MHDILSPYYSPTEHQLAQLRAYLDLLVRWNAKTNLTAVRDPQEIVTRHFGESLFAAAHLLPSDSTATVADLGSGAGFPGLPLKIHAPAVALTLIESQNKKATFLKEVARHLALGNVNVNSARAETISLQADLVTLRAVEKFADVLPVAARMVAPAGRLALLIGTAQAETARATLPHYTWSAPVPIPRSDARCLLVGAMPTA